MLKRWGMIAIVWAGCGLVAQGQKTIAVQPPKTPAPPTPKKLTFDAAVTGRNGQPVTGLKASDFTIRVNGRRVPIQSFKAYGSANAAPPQSVVILLDDVNTDAEDLMVARSQIGKFLTKNEGQLPVPVSLMMLTDSHLRQIGGPSKNGRQLNSQLRKVPGLIREMPEGGLYHAQDRMNISLRGLMIIAALNARVPGNKLVIWMGPGWWMFDNPRVLQWSDEQKSAFEMIERMSQILRDTHITLDAIDPLGTEDANALHTYLWESYVKPVTRWEQAQPADLALQVLAAQSGGRVVWGGNNVAEEIEACVLSARDSYAITFAPPKNAGSSPWQGVRIQVNKPGVAVHTADGYYLTPAHEKKSRR